MKRKGMAGLICATQTASSMETVKSWMTSPFTRQMHVSRFV
jgi:hypothetical protein